MSGKKTIEQIVEEESNDLMPVEDLEEVAPVEIEPVVAAKSEPAECCVRARDGDNYLTIAERYLPKGVKLNVFARELHDLNKGMPVRAGVKIFLK